MLWTINFITLLQLQCNSKYKLDVFHRGISSSSLSDSEPCMKSGRWQAALPMACDQRPHMLAGYLVALPTAHLLTILQHTSLPPSKMLGTPSETKIPK